MARAFAARPSCSQVPTVEAVSSAPMMSSLSDVFSGWPNSRIPSCSPIKEARTNTASPPIGSKPARNIKSVDATKPYTIDMSSAADDSKEWYPQEDKPSDWKDYDCVKLVLNMLAYDTTSANPLKVVKRELHWLAINAPVISTTTSTAADTVTCS